MRYTLINFFCWASSANVFITLQMHVEESRDLSSFHSPDASVGNVLADSRPSYKTIVQRCARYTSEVVRAVHLWSSDYIALSSPLSSCSVLGPGAIHAAARFFDTLNQDQRNQQAIDGQMLELVIKRFAEYWNIACLLLGETTVYSALDVDLLM